MNSFKITQKILLTLLVLNAFSYNTFSSDTNGRPPQYVLISFDGSRTLSFWEESLNFAKKMKEENKSVDFTYYISGVYFQPYSQKSYYVHPKNLTKGSSAIGFSKNIEYISNRIDYLNRATSEGHEIGSHANGHFDGSSWSKSAWTYEFEQFNDLIFNAIDRLNLHQYTSSNYQYLNYYKEDIKGFRAPQLGVSNGLYETMSDFNFAYDTSRVGNKNSWPKKEKLGNNPVWQIPLVSLILAGSGKRTLSMDYNHYVAQSKAVRTADANLATFQKQVIDTYKNYFNNNYNSNRAPIVIGHHFSKWNGGIYWAALKSFINTVCGIKEVKCVTYKEYLRYLNGLSDSQIKNFEAGNFPKTDEKLYVENSKTYDTKLKFNPSSLSINLSGKDTPSLLKNSRYELYVNETLIDSAKVVLPSQSLLVTKQKIFKTISSEKKINNEIVIKIIDDKNNNEIISNTYKIDHVSSASTKHTQFFFDYYINETSVEDRAILGDLPEAHIEESDI